MNYNVTYQNAQRLFKDFPLAFLDVQTGFRPFPLDIYDEHEDLDARVEEGMSGIEARIGDAETDILSDSPHLEDLRNLNCIFFAEHYFVRIYYHGASPDSRGIRKRNGSRGRPCII